VYAVLFAQAITSEFQFLIGTIKTIVKDLRLEWKDGFQFLIGTIKTQKEQAKQTFKAGFQFLIGTIKTSFSATKTDVEKCFNSL